jgi:hypothetical protein
MPPIKFIASVYCKRLILLILSLGEIMPSCSHYIEKWLLYIIITALSNCQPSSYFKCTKANIQLSYNVYLVSNSKCICLFAYFSTY